MDAVVGLCQETTDELRRALAAVGVDAVRNVGQGVGRQSRCLMLDSEDDERRFVLKVLNSEYRHNSRDALGKEFDALKQFFRATRTTSNIDVPEPLHIFQSAPAYLMTKVEGVDIDTYLAGQCPDAATEALLSERVIEGLRIFHECTSGLYGDFQPNNLLVDGELRISFIDPTTSNPAYRRLDHLVDSSLMSSDLGYWAFVASVRGFRPSQRSLRRVASMQRLSTALVRVAASEHDEATHDAFVHAVFQAARFHVRRSEQAVHLRSRVLAFLAGGSLRVMEIRCR